MLAPWQDHGALVINRGMRSTADAPMGIPRRVLVVSGWPGSASVLTARSGGRRTCTSCSSSSLNILPIKPDGVPDLANPFGNLEEAGTISNLYLGQDKLTIVAGRMLDPHLRNQVVVSKFAADTFGLHVGQRELVGIFPNSDFTNDGVPKGPAPRRLTLTIVGIGVFNDEVVQDDVNCIPRVLLSPELARPLAICCGSYACDRDPGPAWCRRCPGLLEGVPVSLAGRVFALCSPDFGYRGAG